MGIILDNDWAELLEPEFNSPYYIKLSEFLKKEYQQKTVHPDQHDVFNALRFTPYQNVKVVLLGQDPYHGPNQAHGLSFSVKPGVAIPPSLKNMYKELHDDLGCPIANNGYLRKWADQGVLLLNAVLTVRDGEANSHRGKGWELFTDRIITLLSEREEPVIFLLWGRPAQEKQKLIDTDRHYIILSSHPSPLSARRGFFGSRPFSKVNQILRQMGEKEIDWKIDNI
ncbi:uracil-DNA glycosylase [Bacillus canaveralius]|uniref:Uracil-DNA glycosylase n=1 Tax=Bacillus canaveralius TaxID=1403243 RepID=A0A2N5GJU3_9BACI|nr:MULTISPECIES: uracil-DNA glycosylase [Bacillus]PLR81580.1 uracil-DNA glycosylase [Bacillus canaveralius]PLR85526.1 uracil-DNA glycosylase [Bacillus sp. V33-4]PLR90880.1 uracil-DNA glycosylase [Bacillus canaveralius]